MDKTYKDLSPQEELELVLWLGFLEESLRNAHIQIKRWKDSNKSWDLNMFFVAVACVDDAINGLKQYLSCDSEVWIILKKFKKEVEAHKVRDLRNDIVHRDRLIKLQDKNKNPLPKSPLLILGGYLVDKDEYYFGKHIIKISDAFHFVEETIEAITTVINNRHNEFYSTKSFRGMIPFTFSLHCD
jgi:hypothetical protein